VNESSSAPPALRYLSSADVDSCLPGVGQRIDLAAEAMTALSRRAAEMPPKIGVHPRPGTLLHAMPAWLHDGDLVGLKWVAAFPANKARGLPAITGLVVLNDPDTGLPTWIMDAARITAVRTAAVSGVAIRLYAGHARRVAILGAGVQARSHLEVLAELLPDADAVVHDPHPERARSVADGANEQAGRPWVSATGDARAAVAAADLVITVATLGSADQVMTSDWLAPGAVVVAVDFATYASAELATEADPFTVDDREQFLHYRANGYFDGYPEPTTTLGEALSAARDRQAERPVLVTHLGVGLADVLLANAIRLAAQERGAGLELPR
jgi:ornithine cyclodeaminase/alanine dehydrogenase-like protein (mu-crystallin family)